MEWLSPLKQGLLNHCCPLARNRWTSLHPISTRYCRLLSCTLIIEMA